MNLFGPDLYSRFPYRPAVYLGLLIGLAFVWTGPANAAGSGMPWEGAAHRDPGIDRRPGRPDYRRHRHRRPAARLW